MMFNRFDLMVLVMCSLLTTLVWAPACSDDDASPSGVSTICGDAEFVEIEEAQYCVATSAIIEQGFRCPPELPVEVTLDTGFACSSQGSVPSSHTEQLQETLYDLDPGRGTTTGGGSTTGGGTTGGGTTGGGEDACVFVRDINFSDCDEEPHDYNSIASFAGSYSLGSYCDTYDAAIGFVGAGESCSDLPSFSSFDVSRGVLVLEGEDGQFTGQFAMDYDVEITRVLEAGPPCIQSAEDCEDIDGDWSGSVCVLTSTERLQTPNNAEIRGDWEIADPGLIELRFRVDGGDIQGFAFDTGCHAANELVLRPDPSTVEEYSVFTFVLDE